MPRRPRRRRDDDDITEAERLWALGADMDYSPGRATVRYFTPPERLRYVWQTVHGEPIEEYLREEAPDRTRLGGNILVNLAHVGTLTREGASALLLGLPVEWS